MAGRMRNRLFPARSRSIASGKPSKPIDMSQYQVVTYDFSRRQLCSSLNQLAYNLSKCKDNKDEIEKFLKWLDERGCQLRIKVCKQDCQRYLSIEGQVTNYFVDIHLNLDRYGSSRKCPLCHSIKCKPYPGSLDKSFADDGLFTFIPPEENIQPFFFSVNHQDKKIIYSMVTEPKNNGNNSLTAVVGRLTSKGEIDTTFGDNGFARVQAVPPMPPTNFNCIVTTKVDDIGRIYGTVNFSYLTDTPPFHESRDEPAIIRLTPDGQFDPTWGNDGVFYLDFNQDTSQARIDILDIIVTPDKLYVLGTKIIIFSSNPFDFVLYPLLAVLNPDGSYDTSFNDTGVVVHADGSNNAYFNTRLLLLKDQLYFSGVVQSTTPQKDGKPIFDRFPTLFIAKYNLDGTINSTFPQSELVAYYGGSSTFNNKIISTMDGNIVAPLTASAFDSTGKLVRTGKFLAKYNVDGFFDRTFGEGGFQYADVLPNNPFFLRSAIEQKDGKIVVCGTLFSDDFSILFNVLYRSTKDGKMDRTFGSCKLNLVATLVGTSVSGWTDMSIRKKKVVAISGFTNKDGRSGVLIGRFHL